MNAQSKILVVDDRTQFPPIDHELASSVECHTVLPNPSSFDFSGYAAVFAHERNRSSDWAQERLEDGQIEALFLFSGDEDEVARLGSTYTLPRAVFQNRFAAFLRRYANGSDVSDAAEVFTVDGSETASTAVRRSAFDGADLEVIDFFVDDPDSPSDGTPSFPIRWSEDDSSRTINYTETLRPLRNIRDPHLVLLNETYLNEGDGLDLLIHLRLDAAYPFSRFPVVVNLRHPPERWVWQHPRYSILNTDGVSLSLPGETPSPRTDPQYRPLGEKHLNVLEQLPLSTEPPTGRHDLANEWGPFRLWKGLDALRPSESSTPTWARDRFLRLTQRRYYKYLLALSELRQRVKGKPQNGSLKQVRTNYEQWQGFLKQRDTPLRLGLVEDEAEKGWTEALNGLFANVEDGGAVEAPYDASMFENLDELIQDIKQRDWDAVLVDLRLTESDQEASSRRAEQLSGVQLIKRLKQDCPHLPIVAVTASNKAWTAKTLRAAGADKYWIKESPEYGVRPEYTVQNAADLIGTLHEVIQRYQEATPIWDLVDDVQSLANDQELVFSFVPLTADKDPSQVRKRVNAIQKRLRRAFGYLVMDPSDHEEEAFAFNRLDLAFLTTWSVLNEVAALYFADPPYRGKNLAETRRKHEFQFVDPKDWSVTTYWNVQDGEVIEAAPEMPSSLEDILRPTTQDGSPKWPPQSKDNPRIQWLLHRTGAPELAQRMHDDNFYNSEYDKNSSERPPLRNLRNKLEESHGEVSQVWHTELQDLHDLLHIWRAILPI